MQYCEHKLRTSRKSNWYSINKKA